MVDITHNLTVSRRDLSRTNMWIVMQHTTVPASACDLAFAFSKALVISQVGLQLFRLVLRAVNAASVHDE